MLLSAGSMPDLKRMFDQVGMVDGGHSMLRELFQEHVTAEGQAAIVKLGKEGRLKILLSNHESARGH